MKKEMLEVSVYTSDSSVFIEQPYPGYHEPSTIVLSPEQIDIVITWLKTAKEELNGS